jgi:hypothetical protein
MSTQGNIQNFYNLLLTLADIPSHERANFLSQSDIDHIATILVKDNPTHATLLKHIVELLTLIPMEERYIVEEIATKANYKHTQQSYNQFGLFDNSYDTDPDADEYNSPTLA